MGSRKRDSCWGHPAIFCTRNLVWDGLGTPFVIFFGMGGEQPYPTKHKVKSFEGHVPGVLQSCLTLKETLSFVPSLFARLALRSATRSSQ